MKNRDRAEILAARIGIPGAQWEQARNTLVRLMDDADAANARAFKLEHGRDPNAEEVIDMQPKWTRTRWQSQTADRR